MFNITDDIVIIISNKLHKWFLIFLSPLRFLKSFSHCVIDLNAKVNCSFQYGLECLYFFLIVLLMSLNCKYLFIWGFTSLSTLYRSYHDG